MRTVLEFFRTYLEVYQPDVMLTYGGDPVTQGMIALARRRGIPVVFAIHNFAYTGPQAFRGVDYCIVAVRVRPPALPRPPRPGLPGVAQPGRLGSRAGRADASRGS